MSKRTSTLAAAFVAACGLSSHPAIVVDLAHSQVGQPEGAEVAHYVMQPNSRFAVDTRGFDFSKSLYPEVRPNAIQVLIGKDRQYYAHWDPSGLTELSASTLTPINDSIAFAGLRDGDQVVLAIGEQRVDPGKKELVLKVLWVGMIDVKA